MTPKVTKAMAKAAIENGATVMERPPTTPVPEPEALPEIDLGPLTGAIGELVESLKSQLEMSQKQLHEAQRQNDELRIAISAQMTDKPVRLKPVRDLNRESQTYLLIDYIDVIPVKYTRKLDS